MNNCANCNNSSANNCNNNNNNVRSSYHQKALQQIRNSLQPFATVFSGSSASSTQYAPSASSTSSSPLPPNQPPPPYVYYHVLQNGSNGAQPCESPPPAASDRSSSQQQQQQQQQAAAAAYYYQTNGYFSPLSNASSNDTSSTSSEYYYKTSSSGTITPTTNTSSQSPNTKLLSSQLPPPPVSRPGAIEYRAQQYPFVPSQVPINVQQLLRRMDLNERNVVPRTTSPREHNYDRNIRTTPPIINSNSPTNQLQYKVTPASNKPTLIIKSTIVPKPVLQTATNVDSSNNKPYHTTPPPPYENEHKHKLPAPLPSSPPPPPLPPKPKKQTNNQNITNEIIHTHESPIPERKKLSKEKEEERFESKVRVYSPAAFKFFMEQHVENVIKSHQERLHRRLQLESEMAKIGLSEEAQTQMRRMLSQKESNYIRLKRAKMDKSMFKVIRTIGVGAFGEVALVRKIDTQLLYAMKTLRKSDVLRRNQVAHVKAERDILAEADNEWVVKLYYSFQDKDHLYFVMDYIPGGDLMSLLIKKGIFEEPLAQFYIAELTCAIESVHKMGFIHRDIKPDNILIDRDGHIKLTDFGLCTGFRWTHNSKYYQENTCVHCAENICNEHGPNKQIVSNGPKVLERRRMMMMRNGNKDAHNLRCLAHSLVGTPNYIAPEVLLRTGYTQLCDWWSVGVILYEMLVGQPPFLAPTPAETQYKVISWEKTLRIPSNTNPPVSREARDLILKLCTDHSRRLGKNGAQQIKNHSFLYPIFHPNAPARECTTTAPPPDYSDALSTTSCSTNASTYSSVYSSCSSSSTSSCSSSSSSPPINLRRTIAPYIPKIAHPTDTSNFDPCEEEASDHRLNFEDDMYNNDNQFHGFFEFTFRRFFDDAYHLEDLGGFAAAAAAAAAANNAEQKNNAENDTNTNNPFNDRGSGPVYV
ncbi:unnamed protein product [Orchesella dallaii]|uniref:non-specific serine/threonine protein kinase n=1 Tax=Orchesella dallaii TaxID=48710 RepID=A0ABP1QMN5_9HEXA